MLVPVAFALDLRWFGVCVCFQVELYEELGLGSSTANVQAMRLNVAVPPPPPDSVQVVRRKKPSLRKVVSTRRK